MQKKSNLGIFVMILSLFVLMSFSVFADGNCNLGEVYKDGVGCQMPKIATEYSISTDLGVSSSSVGGSIDAIKIENPYTAPGQPVYVDLTISNVGAQYPFNLIPLPPNQYGFVVTLDPVDKILYKQADGTYQRYDISQAKWGSWFGSDWVARGYYYLLKAKRDVDQATSDATCKFVTTNDLYPTIAKKQFVYDTQPDYVEEKYGEISSDKISSTITDEDVKKFFPAVYEWQCIRILDKATYENVLKSDKYCPGTANLGCVSKFMAENVGELKTSTFVILSNTVPEGTCKYDKSDKITYCGVGRDGICPPGASGCEGKSSYTYSFVLLTPADAPAVGVNQFEQLVSSGVITGEVQSDANGNAVNYAYTESASCPDNDFSGACHTMNVRVQAVNKEGIRSFFKSVISSSAAGVATGGIIGTLLSGVGAIPGILIGAISGAAVGLVQGVMTWGNYQLIGAPIYEGQGVFYVVAPALKVTASFILYLAGVVGAAGSLYLTRKR